MVPSDSTRSSPLHALPEAPPSPFGLKMQSPFEHSRPVSQSVPSGIFAHSPCPSQVPSVSHSTASFLSQESRSSVPAVTGSQTPSSPPPLAAFEHATHVPVHGSSQHTPSTQ